MIFYPIFKKLERRLKRWKVLSALIMTLLVIFVIVLPSSLLMVSLANEVVDAYHGLEEMIKSGRLQAYLEQIREIPFFKWTWAKLDQSLNISQFEPDRLPIKEP